MSMKNIEQLTPVITEGGWSRNIEEVSTTLTALTVQNHTGRSLDPNKGFGVWLNKTIELRDNNRVVYLIGNGASASMASHLAADLAKNGELHTQVFTDIALITAVANDISFEQVFSEPLRNRMHPGDMLVAISSSGNSPNIIAAAETATQLGGTVVTLSAMASTNNLRKLGALNFYLPAQTYGLAETCHAAILHYWMDCVAASLEL